MNNRIAKKIVKKYGTDWIVQQIKYHKKQRIWEILGPGFEIPARYKNKNVVRWMNRMYPFI